MNTNLKRILGIIAVLALLALVGFFGYQMGAKSANHASSSKQAKEVAASYITAITSGEITRAYGYGSAFYKAKNKPADLQSVADKLASEDIKIANEEFYLGTDGVSGQAIYLALVDNLPRSAKTGSTSGNFVVRLVLENGVWRVDSMQVT